MLNVISSEFYKIFKSKISYVLSLILLATNIFSIIFTIVIREFSFFSVERKEQMYSTGIDSYQGSFGGDIIFYTIFIFVVYLITAEYLNGSIRQMACHGIPRWKLIIGQYIAVSISVTLILFLYGLINLLSNTIMFKLGYIEITAFIRMNIGIISMFWGISAIGTFFSHLFKNSVVSIGICIFLIASNNFIIYLFILVTKNQTIANYSFKNMRGVIIDMTSAPYDVTKCSIIFLLIAIIAILSSCFLFSKKDID